MFSDNVVLNMHINHTYDELISSLNLNPNVEIQTARPSVTVRSL